jgi:hypothetical protein
MHPFVPPEPWIVVAFAAALSVVILLGFAIARGLLASSARSAGWATLLLGTLAVEQLSSAESAGVRMVALVTFGLLAMKTIVAAEERARGMKKLTLSAWLGFAAAWPGMKPHSFAARDERALSGAGTLLRRGTAYVLLGAALVILARGAWLATDSRLVATALLLPGLSLFLHFGVCNLLAGAWRLRGVACTALFRAPLRSESLGEFWARRWNLAFSEMTATVAYRPLAARIGRGPALMAGFALSGLLHEMAISVPVRAGFGLPLAYFLGHGLLVLIERALAKAGHSLTGWTGRAWALFWLGAPLPLLFHQPFLAGVLWPLIGITPGS